MADETSASRAHGGTNAQFFFALGRLREQQIGEVDAGDQEDQADHAHEHAAGKRKLLPLINAQRRLVERKEFNGAAFIVARILLLEAGSDGLHRGASLRKVNLRFQATDHGEPAEAPVIFEILELAGKHIVAHGDGNPEQVGTAKRNDAFEARWRDAHDGVRCAIQQDGLADEFFVGTKPACPHAVAQNHFRVAADLFVPIGDEGAAAIGLDAEHIEEVTAHERGVQLLRLGLATPIQRDGKGNGRQAGENSVLVAVVLVIGQRCAGELEVGVRIESYRVACEKLRQT